MTDHRTLKKLVRERMARTGERYTAAHRHVTAQAAPRHDSPTPARAAPVGLVPGYPVPGPAEHPPSAMARSLLAQAGVDVSEALACGLGGGIGFLYAVFEYREVATPLLTIVAQHHPQPWLDAVAAHLALHTTAVTSTKAGPALAKLDAALDAGRSAQVLVASGHLPWHTPSGPEAAADPCALVVAGRDGETYLVDEGDGELHVVGRDDLATAWAAHPKGRFAVTTLDRPTTPPDLPVAVRAALRTTHAHLTGPVLGNTFDVNMGLSGIRRLADQLADTRTAQGWPKRFGTHPAFDAGMARLAECLTSAYTAPGATRPLYATFLAEAAPLLGIDLLPASRTAALAGERWAEVADMAGDVTPQDDTAAVIARFADALARIVPIEERLAGQLGEAVTGF